MNIIKKWGKLLAPFWLTKQSLSLWYLLLSIITLTLGVVWVAVQLNNWSKNFYDALTNYFEQVSISQLAIEYITYTVLFVTMIVGGNWLKKLLIIRCRTVMTSYFEQQWLANHAYYHLKLDNPDQRIAEDIALLNAKSLELLVSLIQNIARLFSFIVVLWQLSGTQTIKISSYTLTISGYLVWIALAYAILCSGLAHVFGRSLHQLNINKQQTEADYRASLIRIHENNEQIAFYQGEKTEWRYLQKRFSAIVQNWRQLMKQEFKLESFITSYFRISLMLPIFIVLPIYLAKQITFGQVMQARSAFGYVLDAFSWFINAYKDLMTWSATIERLWQFQDNINKNQLLNKDKSPYSKQLICKNLTIYNEKNIPLITDFSVTLQPSEWCIIHGESGLGKTTLLRTLAGIWPYYSGIKQLPSGKTLFIPQKMYLPKESLESIVNYPNYPFINRKRLMQYLNEVGLGYLNSELESIQDWQKVLSGGEQQRLSLVRALIMQPTLLCLDEATNQIDSVSAINLLKRLRSLMPHTMVLSVSHQQELFSIFDTQVNLSANGMKIG